MKSKASIRKDGSHREALWGFCFILPWLVGFVLLSAGPMVLALIDSFSSYDIFTAPKWVGVSNYVYVLLHDALFWQSLSTSAIYTAIALPVGLILSLTAAALLNQDIRARGVFRGALFLPSVMPSVAAAVLWIQMFDPQHGLVNLILRGLFGTNPLWLASSNLALPSIVIISLWGTLGGQTMLTFLAALQSIPKTTVEAATLDGANALQRFVHVTVPLISPTIFFNIIVGFIGSFTAFSTAYVTTQGGPGRSTYFYLLNIYDTAFGSFDIGVASAMSWLLTVLLLILTAVYFRLQRTWVHYGMEV